MSDYPSDWEIANLSDLATIKASNVDKKTKEGQRDVLLCNYMDVFKNSVVSSSLEFMRSTASKKEISEFSLSKGDVLLTKDSEVPEEIGIPSLVTEDIPDLVCGYHLYMIRADHSRINPEFLCWTLRSNSSRQYFYQMANGSTRFGLNLKHVEECPVAIPPLPEQKKIAEILSGIDQAIDNLKSCLGKQEILKKSLLGKLIFNADANLGRSSGTSHCCLGDISTRITDGTHQAVKTSKQGTIPFLYISCVKDGLIDWGKSALITEEQYAIATQGRQPSPGDILYTAVGSYGNAAMVATNHRFCFQRHIALIQLDKQKAVPKFIELALSSDQTKKLVDQVVAGNAQPTLTLGELRKLQIPLPSPVTQQRICEIIAPVEQNISSLANKINAMHYLKQSVASDLLSGRKRVSV